MNSTHVLKLNNQKNKTERLDFHSESTLISGSIQSEDQIQSALKTRSQWI